MYSLVKEIFFVPWQQAIHKSVPTIKRLAKIYQSGASKKHHDKAML